MMLTITSARGIPPEHFEHAVRGAVAKDCEGVLELEFTNDANGNRVAIITGVSYNQEQYLDELLAPISASSSSHASRLHDELEQTLPVNAIEENRPKA